MNKQARIDWFVHLLNQNDRITELECLIEQRSEFAGIVPWHQNRTRMNNWAVTSVTFNYRFTEHVRILTPGTCKCSFGSMLINRVKNSVKSGYNMLNDFRPTDCNRFDHWIYSERRRERKTESTFDHRFKHRKWNELGALFRLK